ncbi:MAG: cyclic nucleotide-binding domain-containing protein [Lachnospiraceae bacterium]|nr:cyclic nucleotide-binding domain-containing protein [Lachnospiraceae bacterium]
MIEISDGKQIEYWLDKGGVRDCFDTPDLVFQAYRYEKGEYITVPGKPMDKILFLVEGTVQIYGIREDGSLSPVNQIVSPTILGDLEFPNQEAAPFFTETKTPAVCLSLSTKAYRNQLDCDLRFLHVLVQSCTDKLKFFSLKDTVAATLEERVLLYLKNVCPRCEMDGVETAVFQLRCSRRQLQRVLKKLCEKGQVRRVGKGRYRLAT